MIRRVLVLLGFISIVASVPALADDAPRTLSDILRSQTEVLLPPEWDGVWQSTDSTYNCTTGALQNVSTNLDTLCGNKPIFPTLPLSCTGSAGPTTIDVTCIGSTTAGPGCTAQLSTHIVSTRTASHYDAQFTTTIHFVGTCGPLTDTCFRTSSHANRIGPAPPTYCTTSTKRSTWGQVKTIYH